jgi:hypothetical protein
MFTFFRFFTALSLWWDEFRARRYFQVPDTSIPFVGTNCRYGDSFYPSASRVWAA